MSPPPRDPRRRPAGTPRKAPGMRPDLRPARASPVRALTALASPAAAVLACLWAAGRPVPAAAQAAPPPAAAADPVAPAVPDARAGEVAVQLAATGALAASLAQHAPADDAHLCATLALAGGRQDYLLRFGADPAASVLDPAGNGLVLTVAGLDDAAPAGLSAHNGSVQVAIGGQTFFGSTQPGAPFRLELSVLEDQEGGRFVAHHLADRSGRQVIDLAGSWRCAALPTAVAAAARPADPAPAPAATLPTTAALPAAAPPVAALPANATPFVAADPPPAAPAPGAPDAPAAPGLPPGTAFRQLLTELDHAAPPAAPDRPAALPPDRPAPIPVPPDPPRPAALPEPARAAALPDPPRLVPPPPRVAVASPEFASRRVFIHYRAGSRRGSTVADDLARTLDPQFARTEIRSVDATPPAPEIRYSHADDAAAASALARRLGGPDGPWRVRSFTSLSRRTTPGSLEVWIPER